jgi:hypothetical protein
LQAAIFSSMAFGSFMAPLCEAAKETVANAASTKADNNFVMFTSPIFNKWHAQAGRGANITQT